MEFERTRRRGIDLNLIPLVDIVFHILVFVMLTTTFIVTESMELSLPAGAASPNAKQVTQIQLAASGDLYVNRQWVTADTLRTYLANQLSVDPQAKIAVLTTAGVSVQQLVDAMDIVYLSGGRNVQVDRLN